MFDKILIANRGEIACRVAATARKLGIRTVAVYSDADRNAAHVQACDEAIHIGPSAAAQSYLDQNKILHAARLTGAQAIHPGYGFLSENAEFAQACHEAGLVFIGPPAQAIRAMGLKAESKHLMEQAGVPVVPGYHGEEQDSDFLFEQAQRIGYPLLIKASAGGGGKGMRIVQRAEEFEAALSACQREARNSFGNAAVLLEKYVQRPRHIEIQIFADAHGHCVHLFERDCSVQRRHQKILEEAPAPGLDDALRTRMGQAAVAAARAVNYVGAGTVEFIVEQFDDAAQGHGMKFYFMEMNTRLQVEHPVTEAITGHDLVEWQLRVASGEALPCTQADLHIHGHAIEARLCAENPLQQFLPSTGTLQVYRTPAQASAFRTGCVRLDSGVRAGDTISSFYDPMIGKLIVHAADRAQALALLDAALAQTHIVGLHTNVDFLRQVLRTPSFAQAQLDTALIERERHRLFQPGSLPASWAVAAAVAHTLVREGDAHTPGSPWTQYTGWRVHGNSTRTFEFEHQGTPVQAHLIHGHDGSLYLQYDGNTHALHWQVLSHDPENSLQLLLHGSGQALQVHVDCWQGQYWIFANTGSTSVRLHHALDTRQKTRAHTQGHATAPMPGKLVTYAVRPGQEVQAGATIATMEAMKMEHTITAHQNATVQELLYAPGDWVTEGAELVRFAAP